VATTRALSVVGGDLRLDGVYRDESVTSVDAVTCLGAAVCAVCVYVWL
jgi:hypothetical protein